MAFFLLPSKQAIKKKNPQEAEVTGHLLASGTEVMEPQVVLIQSPNDASEPGIPLGFLMLVHLSAGQSRCMRRRQLRFLHEINTEGLVMC